MQNDSTHDSAEDNETANLRGSLDQVKIIATGGMSQIFRARQPALDRFIAVKRLREELLEILKQRSVFEEKQKHWLQCSTRISHMFTILWRQPGNLTF